MSEAVIVAFVERPATSERLKAYARHAQLRGAYLIGADSGGEVLLNWGLQPQLVLGDFDSINPVALSELNALPDVEVRVFPAEKDETDLELALLTAHDEFNCQELTVLGGLGGRLDHTLGNLYLLASTRFANCTVRLLGEQEEIYVLAGKKELTLTGLPAEQVSLIPLSAVASGIRTTGLHYPLRAEPLYLGPSRGISNKFIGQKATISLEAGVLLVIHNFDQANRKYF